MLSLTRWLLLAALVASVSGSVLAAEARQAPMIDADQTTELNFPQAITFRLSADSPGNVDRAELRYTISGMEYSNAGVVEFEPTTTVEVDYNVDAQLDYIEPGVDVTYYWVLSDDDGPVAQTPESTFTWIDSSFDWQRLDSQDVSLFTYDGDAAFDQYMLQVAQESADKYKSNYDIAEIAPVRIWVYANDRDFAQTLRQNSEAWIGGFSIPGAGIIAVPIESGDDYSVERVISHEVSHHVLYQATKNPFSYPPTWLDEGLAVVGQLAGNRSDLEIVLGALEEGSLPTLRTLSSSFPTDPAAANRSYATSHIAVEFILEQWGWQGIQDIVRGFRESYTPDEALSSALGVDTEGLNALFLDWLDQQQN